MKKIIFGLIITLVLAACSESKYIIKRSSEDEFSKKGAPELVTLQENYIDWKDPLGMVKTSQLIPFALVKKNGEVITQGFNLINVHNDLDVRLGKKRWLSIREGNELIFLADGQRVSAKAINPRIDHNVEGYNQVTNSVSAYFFEYVSYELSKEDMKKICLAKNIKIQIHGANLIEERQLSR